MIKLFLTNRCNLDCDYCFTKDYRKAPVNDFSLEAIKEVLDFIKSDNVDEVGLEGGEPFLHPQIHDILKLFNESEQIRQVLIFSNGLYDYSKCEELKSGKFKLLINCNSPKVLKENYQKLENNINTLNQIIPEKFIIGINLSGIDFDYSYIFDLLKKSDKSNVRFSFATSEEEKKKIKNPIKYFKTVNEYIDKFYKDCMANDVIPFPSCNSAPICSLTAEQKKTLLLLFKKAKTHNLDSLSALYFNKCQPVIDVFPDLTAIRCFGMKDFGSVKLSDFKSYYELKDYFIDKFDNNKKCFINSNKQCKKCDYNLSNSCRLCLSYRKHFIF